MKEEKKNGSGFQHLPKHALSKIRERVAQHNETKSPRTVAFLFFRHVIVLIAPEVVWKKQEGKQREPVGGCAAQCESKAAYELITLCGCLVIQTATLSAIYTNKNPLAARSSSSAPMGIYGIAANRRRARWAMWQC